MARAAYKKSQTFKLWGKFSSWRNWTWKQNPTLNKEPRMYLWRALHGENNEMIDDIKSFKIEKDETAMLRKAYFQEKKDIQSIAQALQLEKQSTEKERRR